MMRCLEYNMPVKIIKRYPDGTYKAANKRAGGHTYGYEIQIKGRKIRRSGFMTRSEAQNARAARKLEPLLAEHGLVSPLRVTLSELKEAWLDEARRRGLHPTRIRMVEFVLEQFEASTRITYLDEIDLKHIRRFEAHRLESNIHVHTLRRDISALKAVFQSAARFFPRLRWTPPAIQNPAVEYSSRDVYLSEEEIARLLDELEKPPKNAKVERMHLLARDFTLIALMSARRLGEILSLTREQVDFTPREGKPFGLIRFRLSKKKSSPHSRNRGYIELAMTKQVADILRGRLSGSSGDRVFGEESLKALTATLRRGFYAACRRARIECGMKEAGAVIHTLRHSAATYLLSHAQQLPLPAIMAILGHASSAMTTRYIHPTDEGIEMAAAALAGFGVRSESTPTSIGSSTSPTSEMEGEAKSKKE